MIQKVVSYKDVKLGVFSNPLYVGNSSKEDIIENVRRMCSNPQLPKVYFEYDLYLLGEFDDKLGKFNSIEPEFLVSLGDYKHLSAEKVEADVVS